MAWVVTGAVAVGVAVAGASAVGSYVQAEADKQAAATQVQGVKDAAQISAASNQAAIEAQKLANAEAMQQRKLEIEQARKDEREGIIDARAYQEKLIEADRAYQQKLLESDRAYQQQVTADNRTYQEGITSGNRAYEQAGVADARQYQEGQLQSAIDRNKTQFEEINKILSPYTEAGKQALTQQQALAGLGGVDAQRAAINALSSSPEYQALVSQGEEALLQNAAATGGVRGGNTTGALATYRPQMLTQLIDQQYARLGGLSAQGYGASSQLAQASANVNTPGAMVNGGSWGNVMGQGVMDPGVGQTGMITSSNPGVYGQQNFGGVGVTPNSGIAGLLAQGGDAQAQYANMLAQMQAQGQKQAGSWVNNTFVNPLLSGLGAGAGVANAFSPAKVK